MTSGSLLLIGLIVFFVGLLGVAVNFALVARGDRISSTNFFFHVVCGGLAGLGGFTLIVGAVWFLVDHIIVRLA